MNGYLRFVVIFNNFDNTFYIDCRNTIFINQHHKYDVFFSKYMVATCYPIKNESFRIQQFSNLRKCDILRALPYSLEKFLTLAPNLKTNILNSALLGSLFAFTTVRKRNRLLFRRHYPSKDRVVFLSRIGDTRLDILRSRIYPIERFDLQGDTFGIEARRDNT